MATGYWMWEGAIESPKVTPLPPPAVREIDGRPAVQQLFYPDIEYPAGFSYALVPFVTDLNIQPQEPYGKGDAVIHVRSKEDVAEGWLAVAVPASSDEGGMKGELKRIAGILDNDLPGTLGKWRKDANRAAEEFWSASSIAIDDPILEKLWYGTLHGRRCAYRADVIAPGLAFPSTVHDYSLWHGDYHTNYNYQQPFWGNLASNHVEMADAFFVGMKHLVEAGRMLARKYWNSRGTFIHLLGYPFPYTEDPYGTGGICRMAYMTGWVASYWWWRYLFTQDEQWLRDEAYPVIRDAALFYTDFLEKYDDGLYHAFPSVQGESHFTGKVEDYTDRPQVILHTRYCLRFAARAAEILDVDADLRRQWTELVESLAPPAGVDMDSLSETEKRHRYENFPEFCGLHGSRPGKATRALMMQGRLSGNWAGGTGGIPRPWTTCIRNGDLDPDKAIDGIREVVRREMQVNGVCRGMGTDDMGYVGLYCEGTGMIMPLQEMIMQSWAGYIDLFPAWPKKIDCSFTTFRAEGAFLVSASLKDGKVESVSVTSEAGKPCRVKNPFDRDATVADEAGNPVVVSVEDGVLCFDTVAGGPYIISAK
jgi:alpha-L-fucosidase 2